MSRHALFVAALFAVSSAQAAPRPLPPPGWHGAVGVGFNVSRVSSNEMIDDAVDTIDDLGAPQAYQRNTPVPRVELTYRFADSPTQLVLGHHVNDALRLDHSRLFGVRHQSPSLGFVAASLVYSGLMHNEVWEDPYLTGSARVETDRTSRGIRLAWEQAMNTPAVIEFTRRRVDIDNEASGTDPTLGLSAADIALLDRNGEVSFLRAGYEIPLTAQWSLTPSLLWSEHDMEGAALAGRSKGMRLDTQWVAGDHMVMASLLALRFHAEAGHPLFDDAEADATDRMATLQYVRSNLFERRFLAGFVMVSAGESDARIDFHDARAKALTTGLNVRF